MHRLRLAAVVALVTGLVGCKPSPPNSPLATFEAFDRAMRSGDTKAASELVDYDALGRQGNPDWDSFPPSQQKLIAAKMREATEAGLGAWDYPAEGMVADPPQIDVNEATVTARGGGRELQLQMGKSGDRWWITGGVPGMTSDSGMGGE